MLYEISDKIYKIPQIGYDILFTKEISHLFN